MIRNAVGMVISRMIVTATTNRTIGRFATRISRIGSPRSTITATSATVARINNGTIVNTILPGSVNRPQLRPMTVIWRSLVHAAHDRIKAGHHRHGVGDQMTRGHDSDGLQVD